MQELSPDKQYNIISPNQDQTLVHNEALITVTLNDENDQPLCSVNLPRKAMMLSTTLANYLSFSTNEDNAAISIPINRINDIEVNTLKRTLELLRLFSSGKFEEAYIQSILSKKDILKFLNVICYLNCTELYTIFTKTLYLKISRLIFEKNKPLKAIKFIQTIQDPDLYENLFDLAHNNLKCSSLIEYKFYQHSVLKKHSQNVQFVCISHNGNFFASSSYDQTVRIWDIHTLKCVHTLRMSDIPAWIKFSLDDTKIFAGQRLQIQIWDIASGTQLDTLAHRFGNEMLSISSDDAVYASSDSYSQQKIILYDMKNAKIKTLIGHTNTVNTATFSHNNSILISSSDDRTTKIWDIASGSCIYTIKECVMDFVFSKDDKIVAMTTKNGIKLWDIENNKCLHTLHGHTNLISSICFLFDEKFLASGAYDNIIKIWDLESGKCLQTLSPNDHHIQTLCCSLDGTKLISGLSDKAIYIYLRQPIKDNFTLSTLLLLDYISFHISQGTMRTLPSEELYFDLYAQLPQRFQEDIVNVFNIEALTKYLETRQEN